MSLINDWRDKAYSATANKGDLQRLWQDYFLREKEIYAQLLRTRMKRSEERFRPLPKNTV